MSATLERIREIAADHLGHDLDQVTADKRFIDDLGADSLDTAELLMALEEEFGIDIDEDDFAGVDTPAKAAALIDRLLANEAA